MSDDANYELYQRLRDFVGFSVEDEANLRELAPILMPEQPAITDTFYEAILKEPETASFVEGRVDALKKTHGRWFEGLLGGDYGREYFRERWRIGLAHVRIGINPRWVDVTITLIHELVLARLHALMGAPAIEKHRSFARLLDLDRAIIQSAYEEDRWDRLSEFTGMKRTLIDNVVRVAR